MRAYRFAFFSLFAVVSSAVAQPISQPSVLHKVDPEYSDLARTAGVRGAVRLKVTVDAEGKPANLRVERGMGYGLDEKALEAVAQWTFRPAMQNGVPVSKAATIEIGFSLIVKGRGALGPMTFALEAGTSPPVLTAIDLPASFGETEVTLEFDVAPSGDTENYKLTGAHSGVEEKELLDSLRKWKFRPALRDATAVTARASVTYSVK